MSDNSLLQLELDHLPKRSHGIQLHLILLRFETDDSLGDPHPDGTTYQLLSIPHEVSSHDDPVKSMSEPEEVRHICRLGRFIRFCLIQQCPAKLELKEEDEYIGP